MDRYFYSVEMDGDQKVVHMFSHIYFNDSGESERDYRIAEWTGLYITVDKLKEFIDNDIFWEYINEQVTYLGDLTEDEAKYICKVFFDGSSGTKFDIRFVNEDTPCGDYWFESCDKPDNKKYKCWSTYKCDDCDKEPRFKRYGEAWEAYWYCYDGWDGDNGFVCWKCLLKHKFYVIKSKFRKKREKRKDYRKMIKTLKEKNIPITKELKEVTKRVCR